MKPAENAAAIELMKEEKKPNDKPQQGFESIFFNTARNLIYGELGYHVTQGLQRRHLFRTSEPCQVCSCV